MRMRKSLKNMARPTRFERVTAWFVARYSIQLSYGRVEGRYYREEAFLSQGLKGRVSAQLRGPSSACINSRIGQLLSLPNRITRP